MSEILCLVVFYFGFSVLILFLLEKSFPSKRVAKVERLERGLVKSKSGIDRVKKSKQLSTIKNDWPDVDDGMTKKDYLAVKRDLPDLDFTFSIDRRGRF
jgi:hypothetical protein